MHRASIRRSSLRRYSLTHGSVAYTALDDSLSRWEEEHKLTLWDRVIEAYDEIKYFFTDLTYENAKQYTVYFLDSFTVNISFDHVIQAFTIFALFGRDIEILVEDPSADHVFDALYTVCFALFVFELLANSWAKTTFHSWRRFEGYLFSFYWWLDLISIVSLFFDVNWISNPTGLDQLINSFGGSNNNLVKAGRVVRLVRLVRLIRLFKIAKERRKRKREEDELIQLVELGVLDYDDVMKQKKLNEGRHSHLGEQLSDNILQKVIVLILLIIIILPLITYTQVDRSSHFAMHVLQQFNLNHHGQYADDPSILAHFRVPRARAYRSAHASTGSAHGSATQGDAWTNVLTAIQDEAAAKKQARMSTMDTIADIPINNATMNAMLQFIVHNTNSQSIPYNYLLQLRLQPDAIPGEQYVYNNQERLDFIPSRYARYVLFDYFNSTTATHYETEGTFTRHYFAMLDSSLNIILTVVVGFMIVVGAILFTADAEKLVLLPIERMMNMVEAVAANPLAPITFSYSSKSRANQRSSIVSTTSEAARRVDKQKKKDMAEGDYEMKLLESTIEKVTGLLRVGFGEAGAGIISANLSNFDRSTVINPLLPGVRVYAIFGFCDIHRFEEATQKLGREVLTFVNTIAEIVHSQVHSWGGQCNKNLGNAFVIVWRIGDEKTLVAANSASILSRAQHQGHRGSVMMDSNTPGDVTPPKYARSSSPLRVAVDEDEDADSKSQFSDPTCGRPAANRSSAPKRFNVDLKRVPGIDEIADKALIGYLKVMAEINRSPPVLQFRKDDRLRTRTRANATLTINTQGSFYTLYSNQVTPRTPSLPPTPKPGSTLKGIFPTVEDAAITTSSNAAAVVELTQDSPRVPGPLPPVVSFQEPDHRHRHGTLEATPTSRPRRGSLQYHKERRSYYQNLYNKRTQSPNEEDDFTVRMGFGLHAGWAIEGAVGSVYKVDATYLSPHVNMTARLETACKQYTVGLLMSNMFHELLSLEVQHKCRMIDRITVKGSEVPIGLYTYDTLQDQIFQKMEDSENYASNAKVMQRLLAITGSSRRKSNLSEKRPSVASDMASSQVINSYGSDMASPVDDRRVFRVGSNKEEDGVIFQKRHSIFDEMMQKAAEKAAEKEKAAAAESKEESTRISTSSAGSPNGYSPSKEPANPKRLLSSVFKELLTTHRSKDYDEHGLATASTDSYDLPLARPHRNSRTGSVVSATGAPFRLPLPPMGAHHNTQTRLLLTSVHKEMMKSHRQFVKKIEHIQTYKSENEEYADAMKALAVRFPKAEMIIPPFFNTVAVFQKDIDMLQLQVHVTKAFQDAFAEGLADYLKGNWLQAKHHLKESNRIMKETLEAFQHSPLYKHTPGSTAMQIEGDGPSQTLIKYMEEFDFEAPEDWKGFRPLTAK